MLTIVYCFIIASKKLHYLKILPSPNVAISYVKYMHHFLKLTDNNLNIVVFQRDPSQFKFDIEYPVLSANSEVKYFKTQVTMVQLPNQCSAYRYNETPQNILFPLTKISLDDGINFNTGFIPQADFINSKKNIKDVEAEQQTTSNLLTNTDFNNVSNKTCIDTNNDNSELNIKMPDCKGEPV